MEGESLVLGDSQASKANRVNIPHFFVGTFDEAEWRDIASDFGKSANHGHLADAAELVDSRHAANVNEVFDRHVSSYADRIGDGDLIVHMAVVSDVAISHDEAIVADDG